MTPHPLFLLALCVLAAFTAVALGGAHAAIGWREVSSLPAPSGAYDDYLAPATACPGNDDPTRRPAEQHEAMMCLINHARGVRGLRTLARSPGLSASASIQADDVVRCNDFSRTPCGRPIDVPYDQAGYSTPAAAPEVEENLAYGSGPLASPRSIMRGWLESAGHRANLFDDRWLEHGVAMRKPASFLGVRSNAVWVAQFGRPRRPARGVE